MELERFLAAGGVASSDHWLVWYRAPRLWITVLWGRPRPDEIARLVPLYQLALHERMDPQYLSLFDCTQLEEVDAPAFAVLVEFLRERREQFERRLSRQALVRPHGMVGAVVSGVHETLAYRVPFEVFTDVDAALEWLVPGEGAAAARGLHERVTRERAVPPAVREVRELLAAAPALEVAEAAQRLGRSARTLQRQLDEAGSSFRALRTTARMARAAQLLEEGETPVGAIAAEIGFGSVQHFQRQFRALRGVTPDEWRRRNRR